jgi:hypothetical protein
VSAVVVLPLVVVVVVLSFDAEVELDVATLSEPLACSVSSKAGLAVVHAATATTA